MTAKDARPPMGRRAPWHQRPAPVPVIAGFIGLAILAFILLSWRSSSDDGAAIAPGPQPQDPAAGASVASLSVPDFTVETLEHGPFTLSAQLGKPTVLFFSASY